MAFHPYWLGAAAICVSVMGWITALKGLALVAFADSSVASANVAMSAEGWARAAHVLFALIGLCLTNVGWAPSRDRSAPKPASGDRDLRRAA